jgi:predicted RNA methylase
MFRVINKIRLLVFAAYTNLVYLFIEKPKGVDFIRRDDSSLSLSASATSYCSIPQKTMKKVMLDIPIKPGDAFLDIGSGKGYILYLAQKMGFNRVHGIDLARGLCETAAKNINALNISEKATVECSDATEYDNLDNYSVLFMSNPFSETVMVKFVENIEKSLRRNPRELTIIYINPCCNSILERSPLIQLSEKRYVQVYNPMKKWTVNYYKSLCRPLETNLEPQSY